MGRNEPKFKVCKTIHAPVQRIIIAKTNHWYDVLLRIVAITKMLIFQSISDKPFQYNNSNFLKTVDVLSLYNPIMEEHVRRVRAETKAIYLGKNIQYEVTAKSHKKIKYISNIFSLFYITLLTLVR